MTNAYDSIRCSMPDCGHDLYIRHTAMTPLCVGSTVADLADPAVAVTAAWEIQCVAGHVLVLPAKDTGEDSYTFGDDPDHRDAERLSAVTNWRPASTTPA